MAKDQGVKQPNAAQGKPLARVAASANAPVVAAPAPAVKKPRVTIGQFWNEVRQETRKVTWTSWRETWITSVMVFIMVTITAIFFLLVDEGLGAAMKFLLSLATG